MIEFNKLMTHSITLKKMDRDYKGKLSMSSSQSLKGFVQFGNHLVRKDKDDPDELVTAKAIVFLKNDAIIDITHENWEIDQTSPQTRLGMEVISIDPIDDPRSGNTHHYEIAVI